MTEENKDTKKEDDKEKNFRALEQKYQKKFEEKDNQLYQQQQKLQELMQKYEELNKARQAPQDDDDDEDESPYVDRKKLNKKLTKTKSELISENQKYIKSEIQEALEKERQEV